MSEGEALIAKIKADATIYAIVGDRIYAGEIPQGVTSTAMTYRFISGVDPRPTLTGPSGLRNTRVELTVWDVDKVLADKVSNLLALLLGGFIGTMGVGGVSVSFYDVFGPRDLIHPISGYFGTQRDFMLTIDESTVSYV